MSQHKLTAVDSGKFSSLPVSSLLSMEEEVKAAKEDGIKQSDDMSSYSVAVAVEKLLCFLLSANEVVELLCLEFFGDGDYKHSLETKVVDSFMPQIMVGISEQLKKMMENENRSPYHIISQMEILNLCLSQNSILVKKRFLYNIFVMAKNETIIAWRGFSSDALSSIQMFTVPSRYCHIIYPVQVFASFVDRMIQAKSTCSVITDRLETTFRHEGPLKNVIRVLHVELNKSIREDESAMKQSLDLSDGGFGVLTLMAKKIQQKLDEIADSDAKYKDLVRMENYFYLSTSLKYRNVNVLVSFVTECDLQYKKARDNYVISAIRYQFNKFVDFVITTRQAIVSTTITELHFTINKSTFTRNASLGKLTKSVQKMRNRLEKHICVDSTLLATCWDDISNLFVSMLKEVEGWAKDGYEGMAINPSSEELKYEFDLLKRK